MGASPTVYADALSDACAYVRLHPKLAHLLGVGEATDLLGAFRVSPAVREWLDHIPVARHDEVMRAILTKAHSYVWEGDEADRVHALYAHQLASGQLSDVSPTTTAAHRAIFTLAVWQGTPVLASLRFLTTAIREQSGMRRDPATIRRAVRRLHGRGLIHLEPGQAGLRAASGRIRLPLNDVPQLMVPTINVVTDLAMTTQLQLALDEYRQGARRKLRERSQAAHMGHAQHRQADAEAGRGRRRTSRTSSRPRWLGVWLDLTCRGHKRCSRRCGRWRSVGGVHEQYDRYPS